MKIEYENKFSDIFIFSFFHQFHSIALQVFYLLMSFWIFRTALEDSSALAAGIVAFLSYVGLWLIQIAFNGIYLFSKKDKTTYTKHSIEIQDESLVDQTKYSKSFFYWDGVLKVVCRPSYVAIYVTAHSACIIPMRAFSSKEQCNELMNLVTQKLKR
jgi:hypothetical protein